MKKVNDYNDFMLDLILERIYKVGQDHLPLVISDRLEKLLKKVNHPIAKKLLSDSEVGNRKSTIITFIDYDKTSDNKFTLSDSNKAFHAYAGRKGGFSGGNSMMDMEYLSDLDISPKLQEYDPKLGNDDGAIHVWRNNRVQARIGRVIHKLYPNEFKQGGEPGQDIESFVQEVVARRITMRGTERNRFKLITKGDISKYYDEKNYDIINPDNGKPIIGSSLANSCMRFDYCQPFVNYYDTCKSVRLLVLYSDVEGKEDKIVGRALIWKLEKPTDRYFMDRIYYRYESDLALFKLYAKKRGWLHKNQQNSDAVVRIVDTKKNITKVMFLKTQSTFKKADHYPYMDTLKYFNIDKGYLTNYEDEDGDNTVYVLEDTAGGHEQGGETRVFVDYYGTSYDENDLKFCELGNDWRTFDDATWISHKEKYATEEYLANNMVWSDYDEEYFDKDTVVWSDYNKSYINKNDGIQISENYEVDSLDKVQTKDGIIHKDSESIIIYNSDNGKTYYFLKNENFNDYFVVARMSDKKEKIGGYLREYKHKIWDKDKLFRYIPNEDRKNIDKELKRNNGVPNPNLQNGYWYYESDNTLKNRVTGQKSIWEEDENN